jgi:hypothetical protein
MGSVSPPIPAELELVHKQLPGQSRALLTTVRGPTGPTECVVKLDPRLKMPPTEHLREWLACALGKRLGIAVPAAYEVTVPVELAAATPEHAADLSRCKACLFGCSVFTGVTPWAVDEAVPLELIRPASELLAFDLMIHNVDRRRDNPNMATRRDEVVAFDHGDAFAFVLPIIGAPDPAIDTLEPVLRRHALWGGLRGKTLDLERFYAALFALDDAFFADVRAATPPAWQTGHASGMLDRIFRVIIDRRDKVRTWLPQVEQMVRA